MNKETCIVNIIVACIIIGVGIVAFITVFNDITTMNECEDCFEITGFFSKYKHESGDCWMTIDGWDMYVSGGIDFDIDKYVGHNVTVTGHAGCGQRLISTITNLDTGEKFSYPGADLTICWTIVFIIIIVIIAGYIIFYKYEKRKEEKK